MHLPIVGIISVLAVFVQLAHTQECCGEGKISVETLLAIAGDLFVEKDKMDGGEFVPDYLLGKDAAALPRQARQARQATPAGSALHVRPDNDRCCPATIRFVQNTEKYQLGDLTWYALRIGSNVQRKPTAQCASDTYTCYWTFIRQRWPVCRKRCSPATSPVHVIVSIYEPEDIPSCIPTSDIAFRQVEMETHCKCQSMW